MGRTRRSGGGRTTPRGTRPANFRPRDPSYGGPEPDEPDLLRQVRAELASGEPLGLLASASGLVAVTDPRLQGPGHRSGPAVALGELLDSLIGVERVETTAVLACLAHLVPDEGQRRRAAEAVAARSWPLPGWLARLDEAVAYRAVAMGQVLGDGEDLLVGVRFADGQELSAVVYVDHNLGTVVKDGFAVPDTLDGVVAEMHRIQDSDDDFVWQELDLADARARLTGALDTGALLWPPLESDTWPVSRPLVEWIARLLPDGGTGYSRPEWSDADRTALAGAFFASPEGRALDSADRRQLFESILWFACDYGPGDPLRWSPQAVEILLGDWLPRKVVADPEFLDPAPELLGAFVRYANRERGLRRRWTEETLAAIDTFAPEYRRTVRTPRPQGPMALLAAMGAIDPDGPWPAPGELDPDLARLLAGSGAPSDEDRLERLRHEVGGDAALQALDTTPLPDEDFDGTGVPDDVRPTVEAIAAAADGCCEQLLDVEYRTACRRLLARAAAGDPEVFRRKAGTDTTALGLVWAVGKGNDLFGAGSSGPLVKDLAAHFGVRSSVAPRRAAKLLGAAGVPAAEAERAAYGLALGTPDLLVSDHRRRLIELRDRYQTT